MKIKYPFYFKGNIYNATVYACITEGKCVSILEHIDDEENRRNYNIETENFDEIENSAVKDMVKDDYLSTKEEFEQARTKLLDFIMDNAF